MDRVTKVFQCTVKPGTEKSPSIAACPIEQDTHPVSAAELTFALKEKLEGFVTVSCFGRNMGVAYSCDDGLRASVTDAFFLGEDHLEFTALDDKGQPLSFASAEVSVTRDRTVVPFYPVATLSTQDGSSVSIGALDGRETYLCPVFDNVFLCPVYLTYDSAIASSKAHTALPKGVRFSFMETYSSGTLTLGDGSKVEFAATSEDSSILYDIRGSGLFVRTVGGNVRVIDAVSGAYSEFSSGKLIKKVDGYGNTVLTVSWGSSSLTATDRLGNVISVSSGTASLNSGTHVLALSSDSSGILLSASYHGPSPDTGWQRAYQCNSYGMQRCIDPAGETLSMSFYSDYRVMSVGKGVMQGTSFTAEESLTVSYLSKRATVTNLRGMKTDVTFDENYEAETSGDVTGRLRTVHPIKGSNRASAVSEDLLRILPTDYSFAGYGSGTRSIPQQQVPLYCGNSVLTAGKLYCFHMTVDFSSCTYPGSSSATFTATLDFSTGSGAPTLDFSESSGPYLRTRYAFFTPTAAASILNVNLNYSAINGTAKVVSIGVVAAGSMAFCLATSSGIGPYFSQYWEKRTASNSFGKRNNPWCLTGMIFPSDAKANAILDLRSESLFFADNLHTLHCGSFGYGSTYAKVRPTAADAGSLVVTDTEAETMYRVRCVSSNAEWGRCIRENGTQYSSSISWDSHGTEVASMGPLGGRSTTLATDGRVTKEQRVFADSTLAESVQYAYSGSDPRPVSSTTDYLTLSHSYAGASANVSSVSSTDTTWGATTTYDHSPRGENVTSFSRGGNSVASAYNARHLTSSGQGAGAISLLYGLGGMTYATASGSSNLQVLSASFATGSTTRTRMFGSTGGLRASFSEYDRPTTGYVLDASYNATLVSSWVYGFVGTAEDETLFTPLIARYDYAAGFQTIYTRDASQRSETASRYCALDTTFNETTETRHDAYGRTTVINVTMPWGYINTSLTYVGGTDSPSYASGTLFDSNNPWAFSEGRLRDSKGRLSSVSATLYNFSLTAIPSYTMNRVDSITTKLTPPSQVPTTLGTESLQYDSSLRVTSRTVWNNSIRYVRDDRGRVVREDNALLGKSYRYTYDASGNLSKVESTAYTTATSPSWSTLHSFSFSSTWGPLLTACDGTTVSSTSGYPSSVSGSSLSWASGRLTGYGSSSFSYDADGRLIKRSGSGRNSSFVFDEAGRLIEETNSSYLIAFVHGVDGVIGIRVRNCSAAGFYLLHYDALGNVDAVVNSSGVVARYAYDAFGNGKVYDSSWTENTSSSFIGNINPLRFKGGLFDKETGLYLFGSRWYCPSLYRWLSPDSAEYLDPLSIGGVNPYVFCLNDPVTYSDPLGHMPILIAALLGMVAGIALTGGFELGKQLAKNNLRWTWVDWPAVGRQAIIGAALGFAGGAGGAALGGLLAESATIGGGKALLWLGISSVVSFAGGMGAYAVETYGHDSDWNWGEAVGSGFMGMAAGMAAYGAGAVSKLVFSSNAWITKRVLRPLVKLVFSWPMSFVESKLIDYFS